MPVPWIIFYCWLGWARQMLGVIEILGPSIVREHDSKFPSASIPRCAYEVLLLNRAFNQQSKFRTFNSFIATLPLLAARDRWSNKSKSKQNCCFNIKWLDGGSHHKRILKALPKSPPLPLHAIWAFFHFFTVKTIVSKSICVWVCPVVCMSLCSD